MERLESREIVRAVDLKISQLMSEGYSENSFLEAVHGWNELGFQQKVRELEEIYEVQDELERARESVKRLEGILGLNFLD